MTIDLYNNNSEVEKINKTLTNQLSLTGVVRGEIDVENPTVEIDASNQQNAVISRNYCYITEFGRYYYITEKTFVTNELCLLQLQRDPLMSFATEILNTKMLFDRSEIYGQNYVTDNSRPVYNFPMVLTKTFGASLNTPHFYLTVANSIEGT